jgi:hypothetical protein
LEVGGNKITVYGTVRLDAIVSDARLNHNQYSMWALSHDPSVTPAIDEDDGFIDINPRLTRLGVKVTRDSLPGWEGAQLLGLVEFDFQNRATNEIEGLESESRELPRLRHAYARLTRGGFSALAGQTSDLVSPLWPSVNGDGLMWNSGNLGDRRPQLRFGWEEPISDGATLTAAVAFARTGAIDRKNLDAAAGDTMKDGDDSGLPMIQGRVGLASLFEKTLDIGAWGHVGWEELQAPVAGEEEFMTSSVGIDIKLRLLDTLTIAAEAWSGRNLGDLRGGIGQGVNTTTGEEIAAAGGWAELAWQAAVPLTIGLGVAVDDVKDDDLTAATSRSRNLALYAWNRVDLGGGFALALEYIRWETDYLGVDEGRANRFNLVVTFSF